MIWMQLVVLKVLFIYPWCPVVKGIIEIQSRIVGVTVLGY